MDLKWTSKGLSDMARFYAFLAPVGLQVNPRIGERLDEFDPREVRSILVGRYEMRYEIQDGVIYILRIWHTREKR